MSASYRWELQQAVYTRLVAQLAGQGPGGSDVEVYDHARPDPPRVHCRIDGFNLVQRLSKNCNKTLQGFNVHVFDRPTSGTTAARGQKTSAELQEKIIAALHDWTPAFAGAGLIQHDTSDIFPDEDGLTQHAISRFTVYL